MVGRSIFLRRLHRELLRKKSMLMKGALVVATVKPDFLDEKINALSEIMVSLDFEAEDVGSMREEHGRVRVEFFRYTAV